MARTDYLKDPDAVLDYTFDWSPWLSSGETIVSSTMIVTPGIDLTSSTNTDAKATAWISGGVSGVPYKVTNRISTSQGRTDDRSITIRVTDR